MNLQHYFLVAMPSLQDTLFRRSVIYIFEHNEDGAMGIIINKPIDNLTVEALLNKLKVISEKRDTTITLNQPIFGGGPLAEDHGFILHSPKEGFNSSMGISSQTMITTSKDILETLGTTDQPNHILIALGYSGWNKGQLEKELLDNIWLTVPANLDILFDTPISLRWKESAKILGIDIYNIINKAGHA